MRSKKIRDKINEFMRPVFKIILLLVCIALLTGIVVAVSGIPRSIDKEYSAIQFRVNDEAYSENRTIKIKGKLYKRLFADPKFVGSFVIDGFEYTKTSELFDIIFYKSIREGWGGLQYSSIDNGSPRIDALGSIWMSDNFNKLTIWVYEPLEGESKTTTDLIISAPATSRMEAIQLVEELSQYSEQHAHIN